MTFLTLEAWIVSLASTYSVFSDDSCIIQGFRSQTVNKHGHITCNGEISRGFEFSQTWYESQLSHLLALRLWISNWSCLASVLLSVGWWYIYSILSFWELTEMMYANHPKWCLRHNRHSINASDLPFFMFLRLPLPILYAVSNKNMKLVCFNMYAATTYLLPTASKLCSNWAVCKYWQLCWIIPFPSPDPLHSASALGGWHLGIGLTDFHAGNGGLNK